MALTPEEKVARKAERDAAKAEKAAKEAAKAAEKAGCEAVGVYDKDGQFAREYSAAEHGPDFISLAEQFASAPKNKRFGFEVKKLR